MSGNTHNASRHIFADHALAYARQGYLVLPVRGTKQPSIKDFTRTRKYYELATNAPSQIKRWIAKFADHNIGLVPGPRLVVIDIETDPAPPVHSPGTRMQPSSATHVNENRPHRRRWLSPLL